MTCPAELPHNEAERLAALHRYAILDTEPEAGFERIVKLAARQFSVPIAVVSLVDENRQWFKAACGLGASETPRDIAFCAHAILGDGVFVVLDATKDPRFANNPLVTGDLSIRFYAGAPLINAEGFALGTLCLIDTQPRAEFSEEDRALLNDLAAVVVDQIEMRYATANTLGEVNSRIKAESELAESQRFIEAVLNNIQDGIVACDANGQLSLFNAATRRFHGIEQESLPPEAWADRYDLYEADGTTPLVMERIPLFRALNGEQVKSQEMVIAPKEGEKRWLVAQATPMFSADGEKLGAVASMHDVTAERSAREAARRNAKELQLILDSVPVRIFYKDDKNRILRLNEPAAQSMGMTVADVEGRCTYDLFPEMAKKYHDDDLEVIESGKPKLGIVEAYTPANGERRWVRTDKVPYIDPETGDRSIFAAATDITSEKMAEEALRASEERHRMLYNATPVMLHSLDMDGRLVSVSDFWLERLGYEREEVIGRRSRDFMTERSAQKSLEEVRPEFLKTGSCFDVEYQMVTKSGDVIDVLLSAVAEYDSKGAISGTMAVVIDVTERKAMERQLLQAQKMESVGQLTGGLAHDFNNLLAVVLGNLQLLERDVSDEKPARRLSSAIAAVEKGAELTRRLLAFSRKQRLETESVSPTPLIQGLSDLLGHTLGEHIDLECKLEAGLPLVRTDPAQLESALLNLAVNARDAMPDGGELTLEATRDEVSEKDAEREDDIRPGEYVVLSVTDTGSGIDASTLSKVFEPFFTTKETGKGSGLGLSMVYGFMKQSGGFVRIYSEMGHGTTVRLYLPVDTQSPGFQPKSVSGAIEPVGAGETVLVVEDQSDVREMACALIEDLGYKVLSAKDGPSALKVLSEVAHIDLLFTDMVMPGGMDGAQLAAAARETRPGLNIVYTTGYADAAVLREGRIAKTSNLVTKPYRRSDLAKKLYRALHPEAGNQNAQAALETG